MAPEASKTEAPPPPKAPPVGLRGSYLAVTRGYLVWCIAMPTWSILCVIYFMMTRQKDLVLISLCLGALLVAVTVLPIVLFGGDTWYKRLGWVTVVLFIAAVLFLFPDFTLVKGVIKRIAYQRYPQLYHTDIAHGLLAALTLALHIWTALLALRAGRLVHRLAVGDYGQTEVRVGKGK